MDTPRRGVGKNPNRIPGNPGNSGGKKGRSGPKTLAFRDECEHLADTVVLSKVREYLRRADKGPEDKTWLWCAEYVSEYSKKKAVQTLEHTGPDGGALQVERVVVYIPDNGRNPHLLPTHGTN